MLILICILSGLVLFLFWIAVLACCRLGTVLAAIRRHRDAQGDDRCWVADYHLYWVLNEEIPEHAGKLCEPDTMLDNCRKFIASRHDPRKSYVSPQREIDRLQEKVSQLEEIAHSQRVEMIEAQNHPVDIYHGKTLAARLWFDPRRMQLSLKQVSSAYDVRAS